MGSFGQWFNSRDKKHPARLTWVCGVESILVNEVVRWIDLKARPPERASHYRQLIAGQQKREHVWADLAARGFAESSVFIVREAEKLSGGDPGWKYLPTLMEQLRTGTFGDRYVIFVAQQRDTWIRDDNDKLILDEQDKKQVYPHIARIQKHPMCDVVTCSTISAIKPTNKYGSPTRSSDAVLWLQSMAPIGEKEAEYLIKKVGGDIYEMRNIMLKLAAFNNRPTIGVIDILAGGETVPALSFTEHLVAGQKPEALAFVSEHPQWDSAALRTELRTLDRALDALGVLHTARRNHLSRAQALKSTSESSSMNPRERSRLTNWDIERYWAYADTYDQRRRAQCRIVLGTITACLDSDFGSIPEGLTEALVSQW